MQEYPDYITLGEDAFARECLILIGILAVTLAVIVIFCVTLHFHVKEHAVMVFNELHLGLVGANGAKSTASRKDGWPGTLIVHRSNIPVHFLVWHGMLRRKAISPNYS